MRVLALSSGRLEILSVLWFLQVFTYTNSVLAQPKFLEIGKVLPLTVSPGGTVEAAIKVNVEKGFHVQSNPSSTVQLIPTMLEMGGTQGIKVGAAHYPKGKPYRLKGAQSDISVYDGSFEIKLPLTANPNTKKEVIQLKGALRFQACNDKICFFPTRVPVIVPIRVGG